MPMSLFDQRLSCGRTFGVTHQTFGRGKSFNLNHGNTMLGHWKLSMI